MLSLKEYLQRIEPIKAELQWNFIAETSDGWFSFRNITGYVPEPATPEEIERAKKIQNLQNL